MDEFAATWGRLAWTQLWQVTLLIAGIWVILRLVGRNRPHLACALWLVVLIKCVTPPLVSSPSGIFCWLQRTESSADGETVLAAAEYVPPVAPDDDAIVVHASSVIAATPAPRMPALASPGFAREISEPVQKGRAWSWSALLLFCALVWLVGAIVYAAVALTKWRVCWRKLCGARQIEDRRLTGLLEELCRRLALRRRVRLLVTESPLGPAVVGLVRPTIILPAAIVREKSPAELAPLVAHELIHIRRGDLWMGLLQTLALGLWWFHPLVRLASRWIAREAERCCDEETIAHLSCDPADYARSLLDVLALRHQLSPIPAFPGVRPVDVTSQRLERIMKLGQGCHKRTPWWCWLAMLSLAAAVLPGAALVVGAKEKPKPQPRAPKQYIRPDFPLSEDEPDGKLAELVTRTYDVADLLVALASESGDPESAMRALLTQLVQSAASGPWEKELNSSGRATGWDDGKLVVRQTDDGHRRIAEQLAVLREHGYAQIAVEVRIVSGPMAVINAEGIKWRMIGSRPADEPSQVDERLSGTAVSVVEKNVPALLALISEREAADLLTGAQQHAKTNVIQAPKVTLFNGQAARVEDSVQRPFVVGVTPLPNGGKPTFKPQIKVISEGTTIQLRPLAQKDGPIRLDFGLTLSQIRDVETAEFPTGPGKEPITVQVPEVASTRLSTTVEMHAEQTLVLSIPKTGKGKKEQQPLCVLVKLRKVKEERRSEPVPPPTQAAVPAPEPAGVDLDDGVGPRTMDLAPGGWNFKLRPGQGHRLRIETGKQDSDQVRDYAYATGLRIEATARSTDSTARMSLDGAQANVRMSQSCENGEPPTRLFEVELNREASGEFGKTRFRANRLLLTVDDPYLPPDSHSDRNRNSDRPSSSPRKPSSVKVMLDGNVQLSHNGSRIEAARAVLRIDPSASDGGGGVQFQVDDAKAVDLPSPNYLPEDVQYFPPAPTKTESALVEKVYAVADLVIPLPSGPIKVSTSGAMVKREPRATAKPDFDSLIELITTTIQPDSWDRVGGAGEISVATNSYSLVIRQKDQVHKQIADLLQQLRRLQDVQVVLTLERLKVSAAELGKAAGESGSPLRPLVEDAKSRAWCLKPDSIAKLKGLPGTKLDSGPKVTTFNGQSVDLWQADGTPQRDDLLTGLSIQPLVTADFRSLRLQVFGDSAPAAEAADAAADKARTSLDLAIRNAPRSRQLPMELRELVLGQVLIVDESQFAWQEHERGVPIHEKRADTARLFKNAAPKKPDTRHFYLITPSVLVAGEEEAERVLAPRKE